MARSYLYKQEKTVLEHIKRNGSITSIDAFTKYRITRLSAKIFNLRKAGYPIVTIDETAKTADGETVTYARYRLESD